MGGSISTMVARPYAVPTGIISASKRNSPSLWRRPTRGWPRRPRWSRPNRTRWPSLSPKGHGKRLEQRQRTFMTLEQEVKEAQEKHAKLSEQATALGPVGQRADRDFRTQTIMTMRTLVLENMRRAFMVARLATLPTQVSLERVLRLLCERRGARMETPSQVVYWVNTDGLSLPNRRLLREVVEGLCVMDLQDQGKPIHVRLKDMPP